jgi:hypothetical protein
MFWNVGKNHWIKDSVKFGITSSVESFRLLATRDLREIEVIELRLQLGQYQLLLKKSLKIDLPIRLKQIFD